MVPFQGHNHLLQIWVVALYLQAVTVWVSEKPRYILGLCAMAVWPINLDAATLDVGDRFVNGVGVGAEPEVHVILRIGCAQRDCQAQVSYVQLNLPLCLPLHISSQNAGVEL